MTNISTIDSKQFRQALGSFATGVTVVTTKGADGNDVGLTANSFNSASLTPPMVLWSLDRKSSNFQAFMDAGHFAVHILAADQEHVSNQFATRGIDRFAGLDVQRGVADVPLLTGCSAHFECRTTYRYEGGDHVIFVGEVLGFQKFDRMPLAFHGGKYSMVLKRPSDASDPDASYGNDFLGFLLRRTYAQLMMPLRADMERQGLHDIHRSIMSILSMGEGRSVSEVSRLVALIGHHVAEEHFNDLVAHGLLELREDQDSTTVHFTETGRERAIEHTVAGKAAEIDALSALDPQEARLLKTLLQRVIENTSAGLPECWRKENYWRDNNIWGARAPAQPDQADRPN